MAARVAVAQTLRRNVTKGWMAGNGGGGGKAWQRGMVWEELCGEW
jgi:hypothetical protein